MQTRAPRRTTTQTWRSVADFLHVRRGVAFEELLERELAGEQPDRHTAGTRPAFRPAPPNPFLFVDRQFQGTFTTHRSREEDAPLLWRAPAPTANRRPSHRPLTTAERRAFTELLTLGATLGSDFTSRELRTQFRLLARRYHPDRHPSSSAEEKARLSRLFTELMNNYHRLLAVVDPAATTDRA